MWLCTQCCLAAWALGAIPIDEDFTGLTPLVVQPVMTASSALEGSKVIANISARHSVLLIGRGYNAQNDI